MAFRWFGLYRPRRLGSHLGEWIDVAKASTLGVLVLVAIMTFAYRQYEYSRVVITLTCSRAIPTAAAPRGRFTSRSLAPHEFG